MRIATWNLMRPNLNTVKRNQLFQDIISSIKADIFVLTEANSLTIDSAGQNALATDALPGQFEGLTYADGENRVVLLTNYPILQQYKTFDPFTAIAAMIETEYGPLIIYASIIGVTGGKDKRFLHELQMQQADLNKIAEKGNVAFVGDYNISFSGFPYPGKEVIQRMQTFLNSLSLRILTEDESDIPDHISISEKFLLDRKVRTCVREFPKSVSDHHLVLVDIA